MVCGGAVVIVVVSEGGESDVLVVGERAGVAGERGRRAVRRQTGAGAGAVAPQQSAVAPERLAEVLHPRRVDEVVDCAVCVQQQTNRRPAQHRIAHQWRRQRAGPILRNFSGCTISKVHV